MIADVRNKLGQSYVKDLMNIDDTISSLLILENAVSSHNIYTADALLIYSVMDTALNFAKTSMEYSIIDNASEKIIFQDDQDNTIDATQQHSNNILFLCEICKKIVSKTESKFKNFIAIEPNYAKNKEDDFIEQDVKDNIENINNSLDKSLTS